MPNFIDFGFKMGMLCMILYNNPEGRRMRKLFICTPLVHSQHFAKCSLCFWVAITLKLLKISS